MELNYKTFGVGEPLIIVHGLFGMLDNWQSIAKDLGYNFEIHLLDMRNHGRSPFSDDHNYQLMARDIHDYLEQQNIFSTHLMGHSMGGKVVMQFASYYPGFVKKLIIEDVFPKEYSSHERNDFDVIFKAIEKIENAHYKNRNDAEAAISSIILEHRIAIFMFKNLTYDDKYDISWKFNLQALKLHYKDMLADIIINEPIHSPTLFIKGEKSDYISQQDFNTIQDKFTHASLKVIPDAGHWVHTDQTELFKTVVREFLLV